MHPSLRPDILRLRPSPLAEIAALGRDDPEVLPLWFGEGDEPTAAFIREAARRALDAGRTFYTPPRGLPELRQAIAQSYRRTHGIAIDPERITVPGSSMLALHLACRAVLGPGDELLVLAPYWPNLRFAAELAGARVREVPLRCGGTRWELDVDALARAVSPRTRALYVNSPANPSGWVMTAAEREALLDFCRSHRLAVLADEVYERVIFSDEPAAPSLLAAMEEEEPLFAVGGFSKAWAMTGWRVGWLVHPPQLAPAMAVMAEVHNTSATSFVQYGALRALEEEGETCIARLRARLVHNRGLVMELLGDHPRVSLLPPEGAFYAFPRIEGVRDSTAFCRLLLHRSKVGLAPGSAFGRGFYDYVRLCFALSPARLREALLRLRKALDDRRP